MYFRSILTCLLCLVVASCTGRSPIEPPDPTKLSDFDELVSVEKLWSSDKTVGKIGSERIFASILPVLSGDSVYSASADGMVFSLVANSGEVNWIQDLELPILAGVGEGDGVTVVVSGGGASKAIGLESATGNKLWESPISKTVFAPPLIYLNSVILRTIDGDLICLDAATGEFLWDSIFEQPPFVVHGSPRPLGLRNMILVGSAEGRIYAVNLVTGFESWQIYLGSERSGDVTQLVESSPKIAGENIYLADPLHAVVAYNLATGSLVWRNDRDVARQLAVGHRHVFGIDRDGTVFALDRINGEQRWENSSLLYRGSSNIEYLGVGYVVVDENDGYLHVLDADDGQLAARVRTRKDVLFGGFLPARGAFLVAYKDGSIEGYRLSALK